MHWSYPGYLLIHQTYLPPLAVLNDPTYGGVSASYAMQADIRIAMSDARIGKERFCMSCHVMSSHLFSVDDLSVCPVDLNLTETPNCNPAC